MTGNIGNFYDGCGLHDWFSAPVWRWNFLFSFPINPFATKWYSIEIGFIFGFVWLLIFWVNVLGSKCIWLLQDEFWFHLLTLDFYESICIYLDYLKKRLFFDILHLFTISEAFWNLIFVYQLNDFQRRWNIYRKCK